MMSMLFVLNHKIHTTVFVSWNKESIWNHDHVFIWENISWDKLGSIWTLKSVRTRIKSFGFQIVNISVENGLFDSFCERNTTIGERIACELSCQQKILVAKFAELDI